MSSCMRWMMLGFCLPCCALGWITRQPSCSWHLHCNPSGCIKDRSTESVMQDTPRDHMHAYILCL
ncbi:hypothetical protein BC831DRAFT_471240, partial [Entophlyctis helioformis]